MIQPRTMILSMIMLIIIIIIIAATVYLALNSARQWINMSFTCTSCQIATIINRQERRLEGDLTEGQLLALGTHSLWLWSWYLSLWVSDPATVRTKDLSPTLPLYPLLGGCYWSP